MESIGEFYKDDNFNEDHPELIRRKEAVLGNPPKSYKNRFETEKGSKNELFLCS